MHTSAATVFRVMVNAVRRGLRCATVVCAIVSWLAMRSGSLHAQPAPEPPVRSVGDGAETWVLLAGVVGGVGGFQALERELTKSGNRVITIDPFQLSLDSTDVSFAALARRVVAVLDRLSVKSVRLVGHSNGAGVALRIAATAPDRVDALYFLDAGALESNRGMVLDGSISFAHALFWFPGMRRLIRWRLVEGIRDNMGRSDWFDAAKQHAYVDPMISEIRRVIDMAYRLGASQEPESLTSIVSRVRVPVVAILGDAPHKSRPEPSEFAALEPLTSRLRVIHLPGVGHFPHEEATGLVAQYLLQKPEESAQLKVKR